MASVLCQETSPPKHLTTTKEHLTASARKGSGRQGFHEGPGTKQIDEL